MRPRFWKVGVFAKGTTFCAKKNARSTNLSFNMKITDQGVWQGHFSSLAETGDTFHARGGD
jgi:hypothetical protein